MSQRDPGTPEEALHFLMAEHPDAFRTCAEVARRITPHHAFLLFAAHSGAAAAATELERQGACNYRTLERTVRQIFKHSYCDYTRERLCEEMVAAVEGAELDREEVGPTELELTRALLAKTMAENRRLKKVNRVLSKLDAAVRNDLFAGRPVSEETAKTVRVIDAVTKQLAVKPR